MSEQDADLKAAARRLSWQRGFATRVDVPLRVYIDRTENKSGFEEFTDLDVLSVNITTEGRVGISIYDCKTSPGRSTERTFWLRGVADLFDADMAWLVRETKVTSAARQLAARLDIGVMNRDDLELQSRIDNFYQIPSHTAYDRLFSAVDIIQQRQRINEGDRRLNPLRDYLRYDYWVDEPWSNLSQLIAQLAASSRHLRATDPIHLALIWDSAWLYLLALARAAEYVRLSHSNNPEVALPEYFLGGQSGIRSKERLARVFEQLTKSARPDLLPAYFPTLLELFGRLYVRPQSFVGAMQYCEVLVAALCAGKRTSIAASAGSSYDVVTAKLLLDTANFLIASAELPPSLRTIVRDMTIRTPSPTTDAENAGAGSGNGQLALGSDAEGEAAKNANESPSPPR